ncbi:MAG: energy-coupling factor transporter ATPase [Lachnospiraceae bacterium]|nr:energy-coupling factor transporter ATPase [Lachnospiraceae bacterium]
MIKANHVTFEYFRRDDAGNVSEIVEALQDISLQIVPGEFVGILGQNGSGKSTFAKLLNALLEPTEGMITVAGMDTHKEDNIWEIRKNAGMIFQNPDNQIIGTTVEEDTAFGPENIGLESSEIIQRVADALELVGMTAYYQQSPNCLSGGQKQRVAIAGVLAMRPKCIIFDESTAMLDPQGRKEVLQAAHALNQEQNITILYITHEMEEVINADRILVIHQGQLVMEGTPKEVFQSGEQLQEYGLVLPRVSQLAVRLHENGIDFAENVLNIEEFISEVNRVKAYTRIQAMGAGRERDSVVANPDVKQKGRDAFLQEQNRDSERLEAEVQENRQNAMTKGLVLDQVSYEYSPKTIYAYQALKNINLTINKGEFLAIIGHTGSGKSTLIQHFNGLLSPSEGHIYYEGKDIYEKGYLRVQLRGKIGLVFQYPEYQLFAETVLEDVSFGPKNLGLPLLEVQQRAFEAIEAVGLKDTIYDLSPFELSGGQKRRVAIAGVLAMKPEILVLDEPVAGLDPAGRKELLELLKALNEQGMTIVLVSHNMEDVAEYAKRVLVMENGSIILDGTTSRIFQDKKKLEKLGLELPVTAELMRELRVAGHEVNPWIYQMDEAVEELTRYLS